MISQSLARRMDIIELPKDLQVHRSTAKGVITFSKNKELAKKFIDFPKKARRFAENWDGIM
jgi:hypothetical protein